MLFAFFQRIGEGVEIWLSIVARWHERLCMACLVLSLQQCSGIIYLDCLLLFSNDNASAGSQCSKFEKKISLFLNLFLTEFKTIKASLWFIAHLKNKIVLVLSFAIVRLFCKILFVYFDKSSNSENAFGFLPFLCDSVLC
jgi:hypothetical protein